MLKTGTHDITWAPVTIFFIFGPSRAGFESFIYFGPTRAGFENF